MLAFGGEAAAAWAALPFGKAVCDGDDTLRCIVVQARAVKPELTSRTPTEVCGRVKMMQKRAPPVAQSPP